ncbi:MAG TPA: STAS domain-containing protein [Intrasporangium sp.]|nr:STAS domain-containing protein [Intrasporangium sp.]
MTGRARITSAEHPNRVTHVHVSGEIDLANVDEVRHAITTALSHDPARVVLDLRDTTYLDSAAIAMLFRLAQRLGHRRQQLRLVVPKEAPIRSVLELTRIDTVIPLHDAVEAAGSTTDSMTDSMTDSATEPRGPET